MPIVDTPKRDDAGEAAAGAIAFLPPRLPRDLVRRPTLESRLGPDPGASWSLVVGPPGSGKSTLVRSWLEHRDEPWTWISITPAPYPRPNISTLLARAVQRTRPHLRVVRSTRLDIDDQPHQLLAHALDELAEEIDEARPTLLVVDDAHLLGADEWTLLGWFLGQLPSTLHPVVVTRSDPPIPLGRERANGRVTEVRAGDLAFDLVDTERLLLATAPGTTPVVAASLQTRTEGWVAGVRLAALAIRDGADPSELVQGLACTRTSITEFLLEEVLDRLPEDQRRFLRHTAIVPVVDAEMSAALTGRTDSAELLRSLAADGLFVTRVEGLEHYRFHPLLAELLRYEQRREDPGTCRAQHRQAAEWLVRHERATEAIEHLFAAGDDTQAHQLLIDIFRSLYLGPHRRELEVWLDRVPDAVIAQSFDRALDHAVALALVDSTDALKWWTFCSERSEAGDERAHGRLRGVLALHHAMSARLPELRQVWPSRAGRPPLADTEALDEMIAVWEVRLEAQLGDPARAVEIARELTSRPRRFLPDVSALGVLAFALDRADLVDAASAMADRAAALWEAMGEAELPAMFDVFVVKARAARRDRDLDLAEAHLRMALTFSTPRPGPYLLRVIASIERAQLAAARGDPGWRSELVVLTEELRMANASDALIENLERARSELDGRDPFVTPASTAGSHGHHVARLPFGSLGSDLTGREPVILRLLASHLSLPEIGAELRISRHTVKSHVRRIYAKLGSTSRSDTVSRAHQLGLLPDVPALDRAL